ncbi:hypothetical protein EXIGLDRAFT_50936 [Exidia glandulosa HHB12029]|uniref:Uncharacterized protein n=1 Tax=Exidia glandulosa HHB12029 TaxID=1314781 RepID=A0A165IDY3_EXIGL|nr:hypothetical protein EXIGLDRAFT_50936 [Exidia glandulosa HHB12029]
MDRSPTPWYGSQHINIEAAAREQVDTLIRVTMWLASACKLPRTRCGRPSTKHCRIPELTWWSTACPVGEQSHHPEVRHLRGSRRPEFRAIPWTVSEQAVSTVSLLGHARCTTRRHAEAKVFFKVQG